jgi:hypothetical protein
MVTGYYWRDNEAKPFKGDYWKVPAHLMDVPLCFIWHDHISYAMYVIEHGCWKRLSLKKEDMPKEFLTALLLLNIS